MNKKMSKRQKDIKSKLMAAICMLLVSSIMMVSSTYAWFTLSTAPEVTGINTAVGANGNLEMALLPQDGQLTSIKSEVGDSVKAIEEKNVTWGNLVNLSDSTVYGLDKITLFPSALNAADQDANGNPTQLAEALLQTPAYGADGRVSELKKDTVTGYFDKTAGTFSPNNFYGVRAVGVASGMTDRQLDFRNAKSAANTASSKAITQAAQSLNSNGSALANIAIEYGMGADTASFNSTDVAALRKIIDDLQGDGGVFDQIETAYMQYILAYAASAAGGEDLVWQAVKGAVNAQGATLASVITAMGGTGVLPPSVAEGIAAYHGADGNGGMVAQVAKADSELKTLEATLKTTPDATFTWTQISAAMTPLANPSQMTINGFKANEVKEKLGALVSSVTAQGGLKVIMASGAGVYADIADQAGNYNASITIAKVEYQGIVLENMTARMETQGRTTPYLTAVGAAINPLSPPASGEVGSMPITDMYGYVVDLAFKTNAAESKLKLQVEAKDRIYSDNANEETMGGGSYMTFKATTPDFTDTQVKTLMDAVRIVFFDPTTNNRTVIATAKLDVAKATLEADGWKAPMYLYTVTPGGEEVYVEADFEAGKEFFTATTTKQTVYVETEVTSENFTDKVAAGIYTTTNVDDNAAYTKVETGAAFDEDATYYASTEKDVTTYTKYEGSTAPSDNTQLYIKTKTVAGENKKTDNEIMALTQNQAHALSVLVYLDGNKVTNGSVAATASTSMTGKMNLQFSSTATLVPMEYASLHIPGAESETPAP